VSSEVTQRRVISKNSRPRLYGETKYQQLYFTTLYEYVLMA